MHKAAKLHPPVMMLVLSSDLCAWWFRAGSLQRSHHALSVCVVAPHVDCVKGFLHHEFPCAQSVVNLAGVHSCNVLESDFDVRTSYLTSTWGCA